MVTKEQFINGVMSFADREILPVLSTAGKWGIGAALIIIKSKSDKIINSLIVNPMIKSLGIVSEEGLIDTDLLLSALMDSARTYGKMSINIPLVGTLTFSDIDVEKLKRYIEVR